ncbi:MAG TPA: VWA domain-containing protein [Pyrinomonadaceae bacterium]|nr:VWA domain-containing protein [Pyrinomonadaceae bacterium]
MGEREEGTGEIESVERALGERLRAAEGATERMSLAALAREIGSLPGDQARAAVEVSAQLAPISLRASAEFLRAVPVAAQLLDAEELRAWGEMGRRLAMADVETGAQFFAAGVAGLVGVPRGARALLLQVCARQMTLSTSIANETFRSAATLAESVGDPELLRAVFEIAAEIARRSARHSQDFLESAPRVFAHFDVFGREDKRRVAEGALRAVNVFAQRAGGVAADAWAALPDATRGLGPEAALSLLRRAEGFIERGGAAALHVLAAGGEVLRLAPEVFDDWITLLVAVAEHGNAPLVALARTSPAFFRALVGPAGRAQSNEVARRAVLAAREVARVDAEAAISCLRSAPAALRATTVEQFERWAREGLELKRADARARRSYYALETRQSNEALRGGPEFGLALGDVAQTLRLYVEGLTGRAVDVASLAAVPEESRIGDGRTIHLPASVSEFGSDALNFRLYKVLAAHAAGQIEFGTHARAGGNAEQPVPNHDLRAAYTSIAELYDPATRDALDAFALDGYINDIPAGERALPPEEEARLARQRRRTMPHEADYRAVLALFPLPALAARIFSTLENGRIDRRLRGTYRGLARDLDLVREHLRAQRPRVATLPVALVPFELLFQITLCGGALDDARAFYSPVVSELEGIVADYLSGPEASVADTLMATSRVYTLFQSIVQSESEEQTSAGEDNEEQAGGAESSIEQPEEQGESGRENEQARPRHTNRDARELFNAWAKSDSHDSEAEQQLYGAERWSYGESPEQSLEPGETAFEYDEWDRELSDTRVSWCRVVEKRPKRGDRTFVELTRSRYRGVISSIRHQFQLMKPESLTRIKNELDGDDYNLDAVVDYVADRRADGQQSERLYVRRLRKERDVAVSFLLDQSSSTARTIGRHPLQPYTHPGRRIIEIEKEGLVLMSEALEAVGDSYSIYGFTSEGRRNVKFYVVKEFGERYTEETERLIGGLNYQHNTRLGAAVRHAAARLAAQDARTRLLIVLSDGRPYDHDYGDARYAREDTREALREARASGVTPFCITIDRDSEAELRDLYGEVGYTIIDDVLSLPERMPAIYRRLTT